MRGLALWGSPARCPRRDLRGLLPAGRCTISVWCSRKTQDRRFHTATVHKRPSVNALPWTLCSLSTVAVRKPTCSHIHVIETQFVYRPPTGFRLEKRCRDGPRPLFPKKPRQAACSRRPPPSRPPSSWVAHKGGDQLILGLPVGELPWASRAAVGPGPPVAGRPWRARTDVILRPLPGTEMSPVKTKKLLLPLLVLVMAAGWWLVVRYGSAIPGKSTTGVPDRESER